MLLLLIPSALSQSTTNDEEHCQVLADPSGSLKLCLSSSLDLRYEVDYLLDENKLQHDNDLRMKQRALHADEEIKDLKIHYSDLMERYKLDNATSEDSRKKIRQDFERKIQKLHEDLILRDTKLHTLQALYTNLTHRYEEDISNLAAKINNLTQRHERDIPHLNSSIESEARSRQNIDNSINDTIYGLSRFRGKFC